MKIWVMVSPNRTAAASIRYCSIIVTGTWHRQNASSPETPPFILGPPLRISWHADGHGVAGVSWSWAGYIFICSRNVQISLSQLGNQFKFYPVEIDVLQGLADGARASPPQMEFMWPRPQKTVSIDPVLNGLVALADAGSSGHKRYQFKIDNLRFPKNRISTDDVFYVSELGEPSPVFVTDSYKMKLEAIKIENIEFLLAGIAE